MVDQQEAAGQVYVRTGNWFAAVTSFAKPAVTVARSFTDTFSGILPAHAPAFILAQLTGAPAVVLACAWPPKPATTRAATPGRTAPVSAERSG